MSNLISKEFVFVYEDASLACQENTDLFKLSCVLEDYIAAHDDDSSLASYVALAKRIDDFIWSVNLRFITK